MQGGEHGETVVDRFEQNLQPSATMSERDNATKGVLKGIRKCERKDRRNRFGVEWKDNGRRRFRFFKEEKERNAFFEANYKAREVENFSLSEWLRWQDIKREAEEIGIEPEAALALARRQGAKGFVKGKTLGDATASYLATAERKGRSEDYLRHLRSFFDRLNASLGKEMPLLEVSREQMQNFFDGLGVGAITYKNYRAYSTALFNHCIQEEWMDRSPAARLVIPEVKKEEPGILTPDQTCDLLQAARTISDELAALLALQFFAGIRNANVTRFEVGEINAKAKTITIPAAKFKTKKRHVIEDAAPVLWKWLALADMDELCRWTARNFNWRKGQAFKSAGIEPPKNALRHSFASYRCALDGSAEKASYILGHQNPREIWQAYKATASRADSKRFFAISP